MTVLLGEDGGRGRMDMWEAAVQVRDGGNCWGRLRSNLIQKYKIW